MLRNHFRKGACKYAPCIVQSLEKLFDYRRTERVAIDESITLSKEKKRGCRSHKHFSYMDSTISSILALPTKSPRIS